MTWNAATSFFTAVSSECPFFFSKAVIGIWKRRLVLVFTFYLEESWGFEGPCLLVMLHYPLQILFPKYWESFGFLCQLLLQKPKVHSISVYLSNNVLQEHKCRLFCLLVKFKFWYEWLYMTVSQKMRKYLAHHKLYKTPSEQLGKEGLLQSYQGLINVNSNDLSPCY